jgi:hypothetical protein
MALYPRFSNMDGLWTASGDFNERKKTKETEGTEETEEAIKKNQRSDMIESYANFNEYLYSFTAMLFFNTNSRKGLYATRSTKLRSISEGQTLADMQVEFPVYEDRGHIMKMIVTDLTAYQDNQPLLSITVVVNDGASTIPLRFVEAEAENMLNRQIEVPLNGVERIGMIFNLKDMQQKK